MTKTILYSTSMFHWQRGGGGEKLTKISQKKNPKVGPSSPPHAYGRTNDTFKSVCGINQDDFLSYINDNLQQKNSKKLNYRP